MADLKWQPLPGATVVSAKAWAQVPADLRPKLEQAAAEAGAKLQARIAALNEQAVEAMRQRGLSVNRVSPEVEERWKALVREKDLLVFVGTRFSREAFDVVQEALLEYRRGREAAGRPATPAPARP
jgi:TRAP-type C4-dicarboxylate transport system substrate-binding protein